MPNEADRRKKMNEQLDISKERKQLDLGKRKVPVNRNTFNLVIGLGGTGSQALAETKGLISLTCENPETNVVYLAFDTDTASRRIRSSAKTGGVHLSESAGNKELILLDSTGLGEVFADANIKTAHTMNPEIFDWVDTNITPNTANTGAGGTRQLGRLILLKENYEIVCNAIKGAVQHLKQQVQDVVNPHLYVYIISGISGGTGSGTFIDMAYIVRSILDNAGGFPQNHSPIYGYLFMPDVNIGHGGNEVDLERNAYAAFQELDYNLSVQDLKEKYDLKWKDDAFSVGSKQELIFDHIHLVSATNKAGGELQNAYDTSMQAIAQNILSFVADETAQEVNGQTAFAIESHYNNINGHISTYKRNQEHLAHRNANYLAIGSYSYNLPIDDIMMYITTMLFKKMDAMFDKRPDQGACMNFAGTIMVKPENIVAALAGKAAQFKAKAATNFKNPEFDYEAKARANETDLSQNPNLRTTLDEAAGDAIKSINKLFDENLKICFKDRNRGPVYANQLIVDAAYGLLKLIGNWKSDFASLPGNALEQYCQQEIAAYQVAKKVKPGLFGREEKLNAYNTAGKKLFNKATIYTLREYIKKVLEGVERHIVEENSALYAIVSETMVTLKGIFAENAKILTETKETVAGGKKNFEWGPITIPKIEDYLTDRFESIFKDSKKDLIQEFVDDLWTEATEKWMKNSDLYDPRGFVSTYINNKFGELAEMSVEDVVKEMLASGQTLDQACAVLMNKLTSESAPLFFPRKGMSPAGETVMLISVPAECRGIMEEISKIAPPGAIVQKSNIRDRIYAQSVQCGITLAHYQQIWNAEESYAQHRGAEGLHLVGPKGVYAPEDPVNWTEMSTLIPQYLRPNLTDNDALAKLIEQEKQEKNILINCFELDDRGVYSEKTKAAELDTILKANYWIVRLHTTDVKPVVDGRKLTLMRGETKVYSCDFDTPTAEADLKEFIEQGLWTADRETVKKTVSYEQKISEDTDPVRKAKTTMDFLAEKFITAIYAKHAFKNELLKYKVISEYLETLQDHIKQQQQKAQTMLEYLELRMEGCLDNRDVGVEKHAMVLMNKKMSGFALLPVEKRDFEQEYYLYSYYVKFCEGVKFVGDTRGDDARKRHKDLFVALRDKIYKEYQNAMKTDDPKCEDYLEKANIMKAKVESIYDSDPVQSVINGVRSDKATTKEIAEFYAIQKEVMEKLTRGLQAACDRAQSGNARVTVPQTAAEQQTEEKKKDFLDF